MARLSKTHAAQYRDQTIISLVSALLKFLSSHILCRACLVGMLLLRKEELRLFRIILQKHGSHT